MSTVLATQVRKHTTARPTRAAGRYWKGKAPKGVTDVPSDSDEEEEEQQVQEDGVVPIGGQEELVTQEDENEEEEEGESSLTAWGTQSKTARALNVSLKDVSISTDGKVIVAGREESGRTLMEEEESELEEAEVKVEEEEESSEEESESEEEENPKLLFRPVFVPKRGRATIGERDAIVQEAEEFERRKELAAEERKKESHDLVAESIKRELAEKEKEDVIPDIDDTDGFDPEGEFEAWRLRELARIKKEKEDELQREQEREEIERRRALPEEQRLKEDLERANKLREEKPKGQQKFLQKYWHKGAFHQDEEILKRHDYTEATESTVDISMLPKVMQVKNFGKRSRTKYTHLLDQDTTAGNGGFGGAGPVKSGGRSTEGGGCFLCGGPHLKKDCPQNTGFPPGRGSTASGPQGTAGSRQGGRDSWHHGAQIVTVATLGLADHAHDRGLVHPVETSVCNTSIVIDKRSQGSLFLTCHESRQPTPRQSYQIMDLFMRGVAFAATEDDVKIEFAKILHKAPFPLQPVLNFDVQLFKKANQRGKMGILTLSNENSGSLFFRLYGSTGVLLKGSHILFTESNRPLNQEKVAILNSTQWRDPQQLQREKEERIRDGRPFPLKSYAFGRFLRDGTFSAEFYADGSADIACDLERHMVRFTLRNQGHRSGVNEDDDLVLLMLELGGQPPTTIVTYPPKAIDEIRENDRDVAQGPTLFIRANTFPFFGIEDHPAFSTGNRTDVRRSQGLVPDVPMPPGCFSLKCTFVEELDMAAFAHCVRTQLHVRVSRHAAIRVRDNIEANRHTGSGLEFLSDLPFEVAFEVEKAITNWTLSEMDARRLSGGLKNLCVTNGDAAAPIFRRLVSLLEDEEPAKHRQPGRRRRRRARNAPTTLDACLAHARELYLEEQQRPVGRLATALPGLAVSYSYQMVLTPTRHILEGPVTDQSNSVLRRFERHECFLRVSFQDENGSKLRRDLDASITELLNKRYRPVLLNGCVVAGRRYDMLGYSMSGLKEHSLWFVTPFRDDKGRSWDAKTIRESLGDFSRLLYQPARLGARWSQAFSATDPSITLELDEIEYIDDIKSPKNKVMTDGCSPISTELAHAIWRANQGTKKRPVRGRVPSAYQFRLGGAKGMVVQDPTLEGRVVCLRDSQVKFEAPEHRTFDIQSTSLRPKFMFLNRPLIVLLEYLGSSNERIIELQDRSINEAHSIRTSFANASKVFQQHGMGSSFHLPSLLKNMSTMLNLKIYGETEDGVYNDLIANSLHCAETHILRELKYRAHIAVPGSFTLLGVSDEWDCLREGEIFATIDDEKSGLYQGITGTVAITRSPQIHPGDVQVVTAVRKKELEHLRNVVVFSCRGDRSLSSCLGGGDLDGDDFNLILDPELIPQINATPGDYVSLPIKQTSHPCDIQDVVSFIFDYIENDLVGHIAISHLRFSDVHDPSYDDCLKLAELASQAVDFQKTGTAVKFQDLPRHRTRTKPDFLAREGADLRSDNYYDSTKLLGQLFRRVPVKDWMPQEWNDTQTPSGGDEIERALRQLNLYALGLNLASPSEELSEEMDYLLEDYCKQLLAIGTAYTISKNKDIFVSESELVSGTIMANWSDHHRRREAVGAMNLQTHELVRAVRAEMRASNTAVHGEDEDEDSIFDDDWDEETISDFYRESRQIAEMFKRAWAGWCAAESALMDNTRAYGPQSFGLIALGRMLELIKAAQRQV
ncbi:RNA dependent RNA polymerase-domain-containing protein [Chiua virens]|nr:RNA dependent RNA polymerase-domain-containing protein [Chiua virens]